MHTPTEIKLELAASAKKKKNQFENLSLAIFHHPELALHEYKAQQTLCDFLEANGFQAQRGLGSLDTSFEAVYDSGAAGRRVAFLAEYDALPKLGHACGHNLIGASAAGAGVILKDAMQKHGVGGVLKVIGTPAEECVGGKVIMLREGVFDGLDAAMLMHPIESSMPDDISFASINMEYTFHGKASHAAAFPWNGSSALSGVLQMFQAVDAARLHLKDYARVHGIVTDGGSAHNTIPEKAAALFNLRALEFPYLQEVAAIVERCAKGAAISTGTSVEICQKGETLKNIRNDRRLVHIFRANMELIGEPYIERSLAQGIGSTDVGNVTHEIPAIQAYIGLKAGVGTHTAEFARAAGGPEGARALSAAIQILAMSGLDVLMN